MTEDYTVVDTRIMGKFQEEIKQIQSKYGIYITCETDDPYTSAYIRYVDENLLPIYEGYIADTVIEETPEPTSKRLKRETEKLIEELEHWKNLL